MSIRETSSAFDLRHHFRWRIVPALFLFLLALVVTTSFASRQVLEEIYLQLASRRAETIALGASAHKPRLWAEILNGSHTTHNRYLGLIDEFAEEERELGLHELKVYDLSRRTLYASDRKLIGQFEMGQPLQSTLDSGKPLRVEKVVAGETLYELYIPYYHEGKVVLVFELYEEVEALNRILFQAVLPVVVIPGLLFLLLVISLTLLIRHAQGELDLRTATIHQLRQRVERLVSKSAVAAMHSSESETDIPSRQIESTLFFSDIRGFTRFAEENSPQRVIDLLNRMMVLQVRIVEAEGGDVDKLIGDALFARFQGEGAEAAALRTAEAIQCSLAREPQGCEVGIGIYSGTVIAGGIGTADRLDYTVVGDSVNVASRLCAQAREGEVLSPADLLQRVDAELVIGFGDAEEMTLKGRSQPLTIRRWRCLGEEI
ncbi:MAG: adenylate/guanylate cyclase domain-containing protein [Gammaproteobacteria bacterium]|nr:adenylate/guanylate cyclase domain-containing protein [Gammaproteobacteria bacterium]